jgi:tetratricopeptide (TPR) repeat protein
MSLQLQFDQAVDLQRQGRLAEAERLFAEVARAAPGHFAAHRMVALLRYQQRRPAEALEPIETAVALAPSLPEPLVLRGVILHALGRSAEAVESLSRATACDPQDAHAWYNRAVILGQIGRFQDALESYDQALAIAPGPEAWASRAGALIHLNRPAEALASADQALTAWPGYVPALCNRGLALADLGRRGEALTAFDQALAQAPDLVEAWNNRGAILHDLGRYVEAAASFERALVLKPNSIANWSSRGRSLSASGQRDPARACFEKAVALTPADAIDWINRIEALVALKHYAQALESCDRALALTPNDADNWVRRATVLHVMGRFDEALANVDEALSFSPRLPAALAARGRILLEINHIEEGLDALKRSGEGARAAADSPDFKAQHDTEQRAYLAALGIRLAPGADYIAAGARIPTAAVNPANGPEVEAAWATNRPQVVVVDDLLTPDALAVLRRFCWASTVWRRPYANGYLGAIPEYGFAAPLLAQIAEELRAVFPTVIGEHGLRLLWGFKYDSTMKGIHVHADQAAVNVNFWITPDDSNLDSARGGLVVYDANAPGDWEAATYNASDSAVRAFLAQAGAKSVVIPYRANRAVIFDSDLFHETDAFRFKEGYLNRRINITMLFGRRTADGA